MPYKFLPKTPFSLFDPDHQGRANKDAAFLDGLIEEHIEMGGVQVNIYRFKGTFNQTHDAVGNNVSPSEVEPTDVMSFLGIQDTVLMENRDREYDFDDIPVLKGVYRVSENNLEYAKWGLSGLTEDVVAMEFHIQRMERVMGRRVIPGDVVEMTHLRDTGVAGRIANKWYEVVNVVRAASGFDPLWAFHVLGVIMRPMRDSQEFIDILERTDEYGKTIAEQMSTRDSMLAVTAANQQLAVDQAPLTTFDTTRIYFDPKNKHKHPNLFTDDAKPPNGLEPVGEGADFPHDPAEFDYFLRTDLYPNRLYQFYDSRWHVKEIDRKREWQPYAWTAMLRTFMSDRSDADKARKWQLKSVHDVLTEREDRSDPSPNDDS